MQKHDTGMAGRGEPDLSAEQIQHLGRMRARVEREITARGGWISFERYMELALYEPGLGYYSAGAVKLGAGGDFTTAPEISALFGGCIARQCAAVFGALGGGSILELGAGTGRLAFDVLSRLEQLQALPLEYSILEVSADLRARQRALLAERLPAQLHRVRWLDSLPEHAFDGVLLANEVLDALPVKRFQWRSARVDELGVSADGGRLAWRARPAAFALDAACRHIAVQTQAQWPEGYAGEICMRLGGWSAATTRALRRGVAFWIDYGLPRRQLYLAERSEGSLVCHFRHRAFDDPLLLPGIADITAWVDFTRLAEAGVAAGFEIAGFTTQAHFLAGAGIEDEMRASEAQDPIAKARVSGEVRRLMLPGEMGERFKVMGWVRGLDFVPGAFALQDLRHTL